MITADELIEQLPPYRDEWVMLNSRQYVPDIISEIKSAHKRYCEYYDKISYRFEKGNTEAICNRLYQFCEDNIFYSEETDESQTTALPTGILVRGYGDCKHYALFCAGILDSLNRLYGKGIKWCYCFAGYKKEDKEPYHVFVSVDCGDYDIWIDPTPGAGNTLPTLLIKEKVNG